MFSCDVFYSCGLSAPQAVATRPASLKTTKRIIYIEPLGQMRTLMTQILFSCVLTWEQMQERRLTEGLLEENYLGGAESKSELALTYFNQRKFMMINSSVKGIKTLEP